MYSAPSDQDYYHEINGPDETEIAARHAETEREQRWIAFVDRAKELGGRLGWARLLRDSARVMVRGADESQGVELWLAEFAEEESWADVVTALGRAMRAVDPQQVR